MVHVCCAYGCSSRFQKASGLGFYRFPAQKSRRTQWTLALRRKNFVASKSSRICGKHFISGKPSKNINSPDYVPSIFDYSNKKRTTPTKNKGIRRKSLCDSDELPVVSTEGEDDTNSTYEMSTHESSSDDEEEVSDDEFEMIRHSSESNSETEDIPRIDPEIVKQILATANTSNEGDRFVPKRFTFIDTNGKMIAKFIEKKHTKKGRPRLPVPESIKRPVQTVQVIIDKEKAKTIAVDRKAICISSTADLCRQNKENKSCIVDLSSDVGLIQIKNSVMSQWQRELAIEAML